MSYVTTTCKLPVLFKVNEHEDGQNFEWDINVEENGCKVFQAAVVACHEASTHVPCSTRGRGSACSHGRSPTEGLLRPESSRGSSEGGNINYFSCESNSGLIE
jgi:hypothetical protein